MRWLKWQLFLSILFLQICLHSGIAKTNNNKNVINESITDLKDFKKLLRTKTNVLIMFVTNTKETQFELKVFKEAAPIVKGIGTMVIIDCSSPDRKKLCKKLKVSPSPYLLKHYKDGDFHKDYDRQFSVSAMVNFMRDPTGELPWQEDPLGSDVVHFQDYASFTKILKREANPMLVMFYVPWCGYCKRLKPDYSKAATELKDKGYILGAMDVERTENIPARKTFNITGFPTLLYFENNQAPQLYEGEHNKDALIAFMENPSAVTIRKPKEAHWSEDTESEIVHLTTQGFEPAIKDEHSVLIMFYAPWCGHCKRMKPEYERAALIMKKQNIPGVLAALDATRETSIAERFKVKGFPTIKYFINGVFKFDVNVREADKIVDFMRDPKEPPPPAAEELPWEEEDSEVLFLNGENFSTTLKRKKHALVLFYAPWCAHCKNVKPEFKSAAAALKDDPRIIFAAVDCTRQTSLCQTYEVRGYPTIIYFSYLKTKINYSGNRKQQDFIDFMKNPLEALPNLDDLSRGPEPFGSYPGVENILMLTDVSLNQLQQYRRVLVLFYAPWCGHCQQLKPIYATAAAGATGSDRLAAIDCSFYKNVTKVYGIEAYPTLLLFEHGLRSKTYTGERTAQAILNFLGNDKQPTSTDAHNEL